MNIYDSHIHSENSHDGKVSVANLCSHAIDMNLSGITITDHFDCEKYSSKDECGHILKSISDTAESKKNFSGKLEVLTGVEIADRIYNDDMGKYCLTMGDFDFVLCSLHSASTGKRIKKSFTSFMSFSETSQSEDKAFLDLYYKNLLYTAENSDFDSLAHLTYPLRYMNGMFKKNVSLDSYEDFFIKIFHALIYRDKALEINTSGLKNDWCSTMPYEELIKLYHSMGGKLITVGSDAHRTEHMCCGFDSTFDMLRKNGFTHYYYYKKRKPMQVTL